MRTWMWLACFGSMSMGTGCKDDDTDDTKADDTGTDDTGTTEGTYVLRSDQDGDGEVDVITDPENFGREVLPVTDFDAAFGQAYLIQVESEESVLVAWGDTTEAMLPGLATQGTGATSRCTGSVTATTLSTTCDKLWTDMTTTVKGRFPADDVVGCDILSASFDADIDEDGTMLNARVSGVLDLETLEEESTTAGDDYEALCADYNAATSGYCEPCPDDETLACIPFEMTFALGTLDPTLVLVER